jgi:hypothetical protein
MSIAMSRSRQEATPNLTGSESDHRGAGVQEGVRLLGRALTDHRWAKSGVWTDGPGAVSSDSAWR